MAGTEASSRSARRVARLTAAAVMVLVSGIAPGGTTAASQVLHPSSRPQGFELYFTTAQPRSAGRHGPLATVWRVRYRVSAGTLRAGRATSIADVPGAVDVMSVSGGRLLITASSGRLALVGAGPRHAVAPWSSFRARIVANPRGRDVWAIGRRGSLGDLSARSGGTVRIHRLRGASQRITGIAFDQAGTAFYTAKAGVFGRIDRKRFALQPSPAHIAAAQSLIFDRFSGDLLLTGNRQIVQIDPRTLRIISTLDLATVRNSCTQESTDNRGDLLVTCGRAVVLIALGRTREVGAPDTSVAVSKQAMGIDHIAPTFFATTTRRHRRDRGCTHRCPATIPVFTG